MPRPRPALAFLLLSTACSSKAGDTAAGAAGTPTRCSDEAVDVTSGATVACDLADCALVIVSTTPSPPDRGDNTWVLRVDDANGGPLAVQQLEVAPFMPAHNHGTAPERFVRSTEDQSTWTVGPFDLFMPGLWELRTTISIDGTDAGERTAVVPFCVEG